MVVRTAIASGNWGDATIWDTGVPIDGDSAALGIYHVDFLEVDGSTGINQSAWVTGLAGITIGANGVFHIPSIAGATFYLKMASAATITWSGVNENGTLLIGNSEADPIPWSSKVTVESLGTTGSTGPDATYIYGSYPTGASLWTTLSADANSAQPVIVLSEDMGLSNGQVVCISTTDDPGQMAEVERGVYTVQSYDAGTKTVTLTGNLSTSRNAGDYIALVSRPILCYSATARGGAFFGGAHHIVIQGVEHDGMPMSGTAVTGCTTRRQASYPVQGGGPYDKCVLVCNSTTNNYSFRDVLATTISNCIAIGGNRTLCYLVGTYVNHCVICNADTGIYGGSGYTVADTLLVNTTAMVSNAPTSGWLFNVGATATSCGPGVTSVLQCYESYDHLRVRGAYRLWALGGYGLTQNTVNYNGADTLKITCTSEVNPAYRDYRLYVKGGSLFEATVQCQKDFSGANAAGLEIVNPEANTLVPGNVALDSQNKADDLNTWEELTVSYTPAIDMQVIVRVWAKAAAGNVYFYTKDLEEMLPAAPGGDVIVKKRSVYVI